MSSLSDFCIMENRHSPNSKDYTALQLDTFSDGDKYAALLAHMQQGFCIIEVIFDGPTVWMKQL
ncbi:hypothetical protein SAMN04487996_117111 [Dyadobacter soli]|uniref:Uncharacterized protein n=1 Tax=Dyadobacter soli TaxID=659014 RepID=A0A1G7T7F3_9BACT|nr:hypothetical protein [Dyadobacter soli]SDG30944.1 hypothetical protein SAMN04487996_117111 [Dyadobacter soli]